MCGLRTHAAYSYISQCVNATADCQLSQLPNPQSYSYNTLSNNVKLGNIFCVDDSARSAKVARVQRMLFGWESVNCKGILHLLCTQ